VSTAQTLRTLSCTCTRCTRPREGALRPRLRGGIASCAGAASGCCCSKVLDVRRRNGASLPWTNVRRCRCEPTTRLEEEDDGGGRRRCCRGGVVGLVPSSSSSSSCCCCCCSGCMAVPRRGQQQAAAPRLRYPWPHAGARPALIGDLARALRYGPRHHPPRTASPSTHPCGCTRPLRRRSFYSHKRLVRSCRYSRAPACCRYSLRAVKKHCAQSPTNSSSAAAASSFGALSPAKSPIDRTP
jgi:hypothetical protein